MKLISRNLCCGTYSAVLTFTSEERGWFRPLLSLWEIFGPDYEVGTTHWSRADANRDWWLMTGPGPLERGLASIGQLTLTPEGRLTQTADLFCRPTGEGFGFEPTAPCAWVRQSATLVRHIRRIGDPRLIAAVGYLVSVEVQAEVAGRDVLDGIEDGGFARLLLENNERRRMEGVVLSAKVREKEAVYWARLDELAAEVGLEQPGDLQYLGGGPAANDVVARLTRAGLVQSPASRSCDDYEIAAKGAGLLPRVQEAMAAFKGRFAA